METPQFGRVAITLTGLLLVNNIYSGGKIVSLDVSGSVNASSIVVGGSTAKQIDCGYVANPSNTYVFTISFNFTFTNVPHVVASTTFNNTGYIFAVTITTVTTTSFSGNVSQLASGSSTITTSGSGIQWIAVG